MINIQTIHLYLFSRISKKVNIGYKNRVGKYNSFMIKGKMAIGDFFGSRDFLYIRVEENAKLVIGQRVAFNNFCSLNCMKSIEIGDNCIFGENVKIYDHNHIYSDNSIPIRDQGFSCNGIKIGKNCWFGSNVIILKGVTIGDNCVIGSNTVVYKDLPNNKILLCNGRIIDK